MDGNAGKTAKILGVVFGAGSVANPDYVGIGLSLLDDGMNYEDLAALAMTASGASSSDSVVSTLWQNLFGSAPTENEKAPFVSMLDNGETTQGGLTVLAAELELNQSNIDLIGLAHAGLEYIPFT